MSKFFEDLKSGLEEGIEWTTGNAKLRGSEKVNGEWVTTVETGPEFHARRKAETSVVIVERYEVVIRWKGPDGRFHAEMPELPGCTADGSTQEEALANILRIGAEWITTAQKDGIDIPAPANSAIAA